MHGTIMMPQYFNIVLKLFDQIHGLLNHFVYDSYHQLANTLKTPLALCISLYVVVLGYSITQGWVQLSLKQLILLALKLSVIYSLAMSWDFFSHYIVDFIQQGSSQLASALLTSNKSFSSLDANQGIEGALQIVLTHFTKIGYWLWRQGSWHSFSPYFEAIIIWAVGLSLIIYALIQLIIANIMLSILFLLAPLFFSFLIFSSTSALFDRWAGHVIAYGLLIIFVSLLLSLVVSIVQWSIADITENNLLTTLFISTFVPVSIVCLVSIALIKRVSDMAHDIGLSFSLSTLKRLVYEATY